MHMTVSEFITKYKNINFKNHFGFITIKEDHCSKSFLKCYCGFDIETTKINDHTYPYHYQFMFNDDYISFSKVEQFDDLITFLTTKTTYSKKSAKPKLLIFIHNMAYEMSFLRKYLEITKVFAKAKRKPVYIECGNVMFLDSYMIESKSLENLAKDYNLNTLKLTGGLDYSKVRNSKTHLTYQERLYCYNDVKILREYSEHVYFNYIINDKCAYLTNTQKVRHAMKQHIISGGGSVRRIKERVAQLYPTSKEYYEIYFRYLFRGGFTHSNRYLTGRILKDLEGFDFTSSYIYVLLCGYFPMSQFKEIPGEDFEKYRNTHCCIMYCEFINLRPKTQHSIESFSKVIKHSGIRKDNGRIISADTMHVMITELDYASYEEFYTWDECNIINLQVARRGRLPTYVIQPMIEFYKSKQKLKGIKERIIEYMRSKNMLNAFYGCMVTRLVFRDIDIDEDGQWVEVAAKKNYSKMCNNLLSPFWGIWTTAHARRNELFLLSRLKGVAYSDTDSHKCLAKYHDYNIKIIEDYNKGCYDKIIAACTLYDLISSDLIDYSVDNLYSPDSKTLGYACNDGVYPVFKTLGAKRYIYVDEKFKKHCVVAGLPKGFYEKSNPAIIDFFNNFKGYYTQQCCKLASKYIDYYICDEVTDYQGNTELMEIESCVTLEPVDFTMSIDDDYESLIREPGVLYMLATGRI